MAGDERPPPKLHDGEADIDADTRAAIASARDVLDGDAATAAWERARGYALHQAALIIPYHAETNPGFVASARRTVDQVLADTAV